MTSNSIRSFAFGILIAAGVCGLVYFTAPNEANGDKETETQKSCGNGVSRRNEEIIRRPRIYHSYN